MGTLSPLFLFTAAAATPPRLPRFSTAVRTTKSLRRTTVGFARKPNQNGADEFFDKNGVIEDMDGYLNHLSLEYDSVWDTKPSWCQPWTITLTGVSVIGCSWLILHSIPVTALATFCITLWWYIFLYSYPKAYSEMIAQRRKRVSKGIEDTYGFEEGT